MRTQSKYRNVKTTIDGIPFDSRAEARRYADLKLLARAGEITNLEIQPKFDITINGVKICTYIADFRYVEFGSNEVVVEDVKGVRTPVYNLKKRLIKATHGVDITEVA